MKPNKLTTLVGNAVTFADEHKREFMLGSAIAGTILTAVTSWRAGIKAEKILAKQKVKMEGLKAFEESDPDLYKEERNKVVLETVKELTPVVAPVALSAGGTIVSVIGGYKVASNQIAVLSGLYSMSEKAFADYRGKTKELAGPKKDQEIRDAVNADKIASNPPISNYITQTGHGSVLCYDDYSGRYFYCDPEYIRKVVNDINEQLHGDIYVSLNEFYDKLNLGNCKLGDDIGFCEEDGNVTISFSATLATIGDRDNIPCLVLNYDVSPKYGFGDFTGHAWRYRR
jgi:hypothetical protein